MTPIVLLPGMMCDGRLFGPQIAALSNDRTIHVFPVAAQSIGASATLILKDAPPSFALAGLSMGGIVAMEILRQAPTRVERLALMDTNPLAETSKMQTRREPQIAKVQNDGLKDVMREEMKPNYLADGPRRETVLNLCMDMALALGPDVFVNQSRALQTRSDQTETLKSCTLPTLILCGREDRLCPVHRHEMMKRLMPHATLEVIENAGHLPTLEQPEQTTAALMRWLEAT